MNLGDATSTFFYCTYLEPCQSSALVFSVDGAQEVEVCFLGSCSKNPHGTQITVRPGGLWWLKKGLRIPGLVN